MHGATPKGIRGRVGCACRAKWKGQAAVGCVKVCAGPPACVVLSCVERLVGGQVPPARSSSWGELGHIAPVERGELGHVLPEGGRESHHGAAL